MKEKYFATTTILTPLLLAAILNCYLISSAQPTRGESVKNSFISEMITKINQTEIYNTVDNLQNMITRAYGTTGNLEARTYIYNKLSNISRLNVEIQGSYSNIIATLPSDDITSDAIYIVGAHYDSISSDPNYAPGATDNGVGVAIVLEFARIMSQYSFNHTLKFAFWNAEENGLLGSAEYVKQIHNSGINISLYLNYDSSCYDPNNRMILDIMFNQQSSWISDMMTEYNTLYGINFTLTYNVHDCGSDHESFWAYGYTAVMTHEETHSPGMHTPQDTVDQVSIDYAQKNGQLGMAVLAALAEVRGAAPTINESPSFLVFIGSTITASASIILSRKGADSRQNAKNLNH